MRELFADLPDEQAPPTPPGYLDTVLSVARRSVRRRRAVAVAAWAVVVLVLLVIAAPRVRLTAEPAAPVTRPTLPDRFAGYSTLTAPVDAAPAGRAVALYGYGNGELFDMYQPLVVGADRDTYRRVEEMQARDLPSALLAQDGTRVLLGDDRGAVTDLLLVDLITGRRQSVPIGAPVGVRLLAWSPDGRFVAYSAAALPGVPDGSSNFVESQVARAGVLRLLDLDTGHSTEVSAAAPAWMAAFASDSRRLVVQVNQEAHLLDVNGVETASVRLPEGRELVGNVGWSPDGGLLALGPMFTDGQAGGITAHDVYIGTRRGITFVPTPGSNRAAPAQVDGVQLLGWRSADDVLVADTDTADRLTIAEAHLADGTRRTVSRFDTDATCEFGTQPCQVFDLQLAAALIPDLTIRPAGAAQRGPWPLWFTATVTGSVLGTALLIWYVARRIRRRRRPDPRASPVR